MISIRSQKIMNNIPKKVREDLCRPHEDAKTIIQSSGEKKKSENLLSFLHEIFFISSEICGDRFRHCDFPRGSYFTELF